MINLTWRGAWFMLLLIGFLGFLAGSVDQPTMVLWNSNVADDDRDDGEAEAQTAPDQTAVARRRVAFLRRGGLGRALVLLRCVFHTPSADANSRAPISPEISSFSTPTLLALRL